MSTRLASGRFARACATFAALASSGSLWAAESGFIDGTKANLNLRNFYFNRNFVDPAYTAQNKAEEWTQSFIFGLTSGYTQGPVGFGIDALGLYSVKLDGGAGTYGTQLLPTHAGNEPAKDFGRLALAAKAKVSKTDIKVGEWFAVLPILRSDDGRSLPQTFQGAQIHSAEIQNLELWGGQMRQNSPRNDASMQDMFMQGRANATSDRFNFVGGEYKFNEKRTQIGLWYAQLEDIYHQKFINLIHYQPVGSWTLGANLGYFIGEDDGSARAGALDNRTAYALLSAKQGGGTFYVGLQRVSGDSPWMRVNGTSGGALGNDSYNSSYDNARERSWQVRYDYNFAAFGMPGLTLMNRYLSGDNVHTGTITDGKEWGRESEVQYEVQSGPLKKLLIRWRNSTMRRDYSASGSFDENRIILNYPISVL